MVCWPLYDSPLQIQCERNR